MPTEKQIAAQLKREEIQMKRDLVSRVSVAALIILEESYLFGSRLWPKDGFKMGNGLDTNPKECIFMGINAYGIHKDPVIGRLGLHPTTFNETRKKSQYKHIRHILDYAVYDNILFEDEFRNATWGHLWFQFTINK